MHGLDQVLSKRLQIFLIQPLKASELKISVRLEILLQTLWASCRILKRTKAGFKLFRRAQSKIENMKAKYGKLETSIDGICEALEEHQLRLSKDIAVLDKLYDVNLANYKELTLYIIAGRNKLNRARENDLAQMLRHAEETGLPEDAQAANDFSSLCDRFDKRLHDLELTRTVALQMAPQIRMIQSNDTVMTEKLQSTLVNTIPLWKSQMVFSLGLAHSKSALDAQRAVNDVTKRAFA